MSGQTAPANAGLRDAEPQGFRHEAFLYDSESAYLDGLVPFLEEGLDSDAAMMVAVSQQKIEKLSDALGSDSGRIRFLDMAEVGANPGWIIPAWADFVAENAASGRPLRGIGEPIWASRTPAELAECQRHEALLNVAFDDIAEFQLLCPYDTRALDARVVSEAHANHPTFRHADTAGASGSYRGLDAITQPFDELLPPPVEAPRELTFTSTDLPVVRQFAGDHAADLSFDADSAAEVVLATSELATNTIRHGGGSGLLRSWRDGDYLILEVSDSGRITDPLAGRRRPRLDQEGGYGLWMVNRLAHLVQIRQLPTGNVVRVHFSRV